MPDPWERGVQQTGTLTVFATQAFQQSPIWGGGIFNSLLDEFNRLAALNRFGVRMQPSPTAPDPKGPGANVSLDITLGTCKYFDYKGDPQTDTLDVTPGQIHGRCFSVTNKSNKLIRAFIFVPANPQARPGRTVGRGVRMGLALHELIHSCGLHNEDPGHGALNAPPTGDTDVFATGDTFIEGSTPDHDKLILPSTGKLVPDSNGQFFLTPRTVMLIQDVWLFGQF
jgi:hypothetical protein